MKHALGGGRDRTKERTEIANAKGGESETRPLQTGREKGLTRVKRCGLVVSAGSKGVAASRLRKFYPRGIGTSGEGRNPRGRLGEVTV